MKKFTKILSLALCIMLLCSSFVIASETEAVNLKESKIQELTTVSEKTGIPLSELQEIAQEPEVDMQDFMEQYLEISTFEDEGNISKSSSGGSGSKAMTSAQFNSLKNNALRGNILISKDQTTYGVTHGHAGIVTIQGSKTVEALGSGILSKECNLDGWWNKMYTARVFYHTTCNMQHATIANNSGLHHMLIIIFVAKHTKLFQKLLMQN